MGPSDFDQNLILLKKKEAKPLCPEVSAKTFAIAPQTPFKLSEFLDPPQFELIYYWLVIDSSILDDY